MANILLNSLYKYYNERNIKKLLEVLEEDTKVSLRIIDWFVTNYSKKNYIIYGIQDKRGKKTRFKVYVCMRMCRKLPQLH